jgi:hypothetical protein
MKSQPERYMDTTLLLAQKDSNNVSPDCSIIKERFGFLVKKTINQYITIQNQSFTSNFQTSDKFKS